jgi:hypothetical protein
MREPLNVERGSLDFQIPIFSFPLDGGRPGWGCYVAAEVCGEAPPLQLFAVEGEKIGFGQVDMQCCSVE